MSFFVKNKSLGQKCWPNVLWFWLNTIILLFRHSYWTVVAERSKSLGQDSPSLKLYYLSLWLSLFQWKTLILEKNVMVELGESQPCILAMPFNESLHVLVLKQICHRQVLKSWNFSHLAKKVSIWQQEIFLLCKFKNDVTWQGRSAIMRRHQTE